MAASPSTFPEAFISSSSYSHPSWTYDVFLSFRGEDTRKGFTDHLYHALTDAGIYTFRDDDELRRGEDLSSGLLSAIERSRLSLVVISKNYAASRWCLEELVKIMECQRMRRLHVRPIFYHVEPSDVRHQRGSLADAFAEHEERYSQDKDMVQRWRAALKDVGDIVGWDVHHNIHEAKAIRGIIDTISLQGRTMLPIARHPVGIAPRVKEVTSLLRIEEVGAVLMVGIWGMGGIGKTSISKAIHNRFFDSFEAVSFLANIRETCEQPDGQLRLQKQLLSDTLKTSKIKINSVGNGIAIIKKRLCRKKVLVILDDVSQVEQVDVIVRSRDCFGPGSRIVITTRDEQLLRELGVDAIYPAEKMNDEEASRLFIWHAFKRADPTEDFMDLTRSILAYCGGLPIALEVLGSYLSSKEMPQWRIVLEKLKIIPHNKIQKILRISYDGLDDDITKDIFLDIVCFLLGMDKYYVIQIMYGCGFYGEFGIEVLIERCLLSVDQEGKLTTHDLLRDMGREIVRGENPKEPGKRSRVWRRQDALDILAKHQGGEAIEGIALKLPSSSYKDLDTRAFKAMKRLRVLQLDYVQLRGDYKHLFEELRWLHWHGFPLKFMPTNFYPRVKKQCFEELKFLNLGHSYFLTQTPNFARFPNLKELVLKYCTSLFEVHKSIGDLRNLVLVNFEGCKNLESLPSCLYLRKSIQTLIISGCSKIDTLPEDFGEMEALTTFRANDISIEQVPCTIIKLKKLKDVSLYGFTGSPASLIDSVFWSHTSIGGSPSSLSLLPAPPQSLNSRRELFLRSFGSSKLQFIPGFDKLCMIHEEACDNIMNTSKQSIFQECAGGRFGNFLRGNDIPDCFMYNEGSSICFKVPCNIDHALKGFIVCIVYSASCVDKTVAKDLPSMTIINSTKKRTQTEQPVTVDEEIFPEDHIWEYNVSQSSFNLEGGDEVEVSVDFGSRVTVQKIGVCPYYDLIDQDKMIDYQSTSNRDVIAINADEDASIDQAAIKLKRTSSDDNAEASNGEFCGSREAKRLRCEKDINDTNQVMVSFDQKLGP